MRFACVELSLDKRALSDTLTFSLLYQLILGVIG